MTCAIMEGVEHFRAVAWAFGPCIVAFQYLRPVVSIDACFMSGRYEGRLRIDCAYDAKNQLLPLAFAIVEKESAKFKVRYLRKVDKKCPNDPFEPSNYDKIFQTVDGGFWFEIMTTNGSESLNNIFNKSRRLPVAAIVEETFYKCNAWFIQRRARTIDLADANKQWSERVENKLRKRWEKAAR